MTSYSEVESLSGGHGLTVKHCGDGAERFRSLPQFFGNLTKARAVGAQHPYFVSVHDTARTLWSGRWQHRSWPRAAELFFPIGRPSIEHNAAYGKYQLSERWHRKIVWREISHLHASHASPQLRVLRTLLEGLMHCRGRYA